MIVRMLVAGDLELCYDARILSEYRDVLYRHKFSFKRSLVDVVIKYIETFGVPVSSNPLSSYLRDRDEELELGRTATDREKRSSRKDYISIEKAYKKIR